MVIQEFYPVELVYRFGENLRIDAYKGRTEKLCIRDVYKRQVIFITNISGILDMIRSEDNMLGKKMCIRDRMQT